MFFNLYSEVSKCKARLNRLEDDFGALDGMISELRSRISDLEKKPTASPSYDTTLKSKVEDLELWRGKMHELLITASPVQKKEKLNSLALSKLAGRM